MDPRPLPSLRFQNLPRERLFSLCEEACSPSGAQPGANLREAV